MYMDAYKIVHHYNFSPFMKIVLGSHLKKKGKKSNQVEDTTSNNNIQDTNYGKIHFKFEKKPMSYHQL